MTAPMQSTPVLLVIDQTRDAGESLQIIGEANTPAWHTDVADSLNAVRQQATEPRLVLLHPGDGTRWTEDQMLDEVTARGWASRTVLVTSAHLPGRIHDLQAMRAQRGLKALLPTPIDIALISSWLHEPVPDLTPSASVAADQHAAEVVFLPNEKINAQHVNLLTPAVLVFSVSPENQFPHVEWANDAAKRVEGGALNRADIRRIALLRSMLEEDAANHQVPDRRAKALDWDVPKKKWVECRLHTLEEGRLFWYTRDWRHDQAVEEEFVKFEKEKGLSRRFDKLCDYLARRWTITRVRLYQVIRLPDGLGRIDDSEDLTHDPVAMLDRTDCKDIPWVVVPRFQSGSGWPDHQTDPRAGAASWWSHIFLWSSLKTRPSTADGDDWRDPQSPDRIRNETHLETVNGNCTIDSTETVGWGPEPSQRLMEVFPCETQSGPDGSESVLVSAMLTLDRRHDHVLQQGDAALTQPALERPHFTAAAVSGRLGQALDKDEAEALAGGALPAIREQLARWLREDHLDRCRRWHKELSKYILSGISTLAGSGGMAALSKVCDDLVIGWPGLWQTEMDRVELPRDRRASVRNWFFATEADAGHIEVPAGTGPLWKVYQSSTAPLAKSSLVRQLWDDGLPDWTFRTVQDYPTWRQDNPVIPVAGVEQRVQDELALVRTWVGIRLPQQQGFPKAMMVVHISDATHSAWTTVLQLLVIAAQRLYPAFMLALADEHERSAWAASVVHELKTGAATMHQSLRLAAQKPNAQIKFTRLIDIAHGLENLSSDYLSFLDPKHALFDNSDMPAAPVRVLEQVYHALAPWTDRYPQRAYQVDPTDLVTDQEMRLAAPHLWRRVIRVLLHNAFRHGKQDVAVKIARRGDRLQLTVTNAAGQDAIAQLIAAHGSGRGPITAPYATVRVGMRAALRLCRAAGAGLDWHAGEPDPDGLQQVKHELSWPVQPATTGQGTAT